MANEVKTPIPARLYNAAVGGHVAGTEDIYDDTKGKTQKQINTEVEQSLGSGGSVDSRIQSAVNNEKSRAEGVESSQAERITTLENAVGSGGSVDERIATEGTKHYLKSETYTKDEVHGLITTPNQQYITVTATNQTTAVTDVLPASGEADTVYRVGNWDGSAYDDTVYSEYAWNGTAYVFLRKKDYGIDDEPTAGSDNLVKSGGVAKQLQQITNKQVDDFSENSISIKTDKGKKVLDINEDRTKIENDIVVGDDKGVVSGKETRSTDEELQLRSNNNLNEFSRTNNNGITSLDFRLQNNQSIIKYWSDKKIVIVGDSHVEYPTGRATKNWVKQLSDVTGANIVNLGVSGTGYIVGVSQNDCYYQRILAHAPNDADFYLIHGGANDAMFTTQEIGTITDTIEDNTISGYVNAAFDAILSVNPLANFAVSTALPSKDGNEQNPGNRRGLVAQAIINICIYRGIPYIDMYHDSGLRPWEEAFRNGYYTRDVDNDVNNGEHPDENGNRIFLLPKYNEFFKKFLNMTEYLSTLIVNSIIGNAYVDTSGSIGSASNHAVAVYRIGDMSRRRLKVLTGCTYNSGTAGCMCFYNSSNVKVGDYLMINKDTIIENIPSDARTIKVTYKVQGIGNIENYKIVEIV